MTSNIENQLSRILNDLGKIGGIGSSLIADNNGNVICHSMSRRTDTSLFGPMAHVITSSSKRLLNSANQGEIERVLVESKGGKALFLHLGNVHFIVLMEISANVGLVMVSAKRAALEIIEITKDMIPSVPVEEEVIVTTEEETPVASEMPEEIVEPEIEVSEEVGPEKPVEVIEKGLKAMPEAGIDSEIEISLEATSEAETESEDAGIQVKVGDAHISPEIQTESDMESKLEVETQIEEAETQEEVTEGISESPDVLPVIKPPISFPKLPEDVKIPAGDEEKSDLILDIYEAIFLAMSIGASKIMGVAPARGLIKRFLPLQDCKSLLNGVDVKSNSVVDFDKIRENAENIPLNERESTFINDFSKIISIVTENYGKVMGYGAFRGIVRAEFKIINDSYGEAMDELGIKDKMHPELTDLFN